MNHHSGTHGFMNGVTGASFISQSDLSGYIIQADMLNQATMRKFMNKTLFSDVYTVSDHAGGGAWLELQHHEHHDDCNGYCHCVTMLLSLCAVTVTV